MLNNTNKTQGQAMQILFSLILLLSLMISGLLTIAFGADVYEKINERAVENFNNATALAYICGKVRQEDVSSAVSVEEQGGISVLKIAEKYDESGYYTKIYVKDGKLKELFASEDSSVALEDGLDVMNLNGIEFEMEKPNLLRVSLVGADDKKTERIDEVYLHLRSEL
ncbi:MAG: DUF4860 domain-containing protein [Eubacteriales bacterium]